MYAFFVHFNARQFFEFKCAPTAFAQGMPRVWVRFVFARNIRLKRPKRDKTEKRIDTHTLRRTSCLFRILQTEIHKNSFHKWRMERRKNGNRVAKKKKKNVRKTKYAK